MSMLFEVKPVDRQYYQERIRDFLPDRVIDVHTHIWREAFTTRTGDAQGRTVTWPARVARENPVEDLLETYRLLLPGKQVTPLLFGTVQVAADLPAANDYVGRCAAEHGLPALLFAAPQWSAAELEGQLQAGGFLGVKVYLSLADAYLPAKEIRIFDFLPPHQLEVLDRLGSIVMLHIPRDGRLKDPVNLAQMLLIEERYPNVKLIIAHVGRAYCPEDVGDAFQVLSATQRMYFDISANTNATVFAACIRAVGPRRILFGSDLPITRMRMRRVCEAGTYVNLVPQGLYGDVSGDRNLREVDGDEAARLSFFLYEEIDAFRRAAEETGLTPADVADVFYGNAARLLANG
jgi:predicted TIM-barrel fold metal-dependent hydrolase